MVHHLTPRLDYDTALRPVSFMLCAAPQLRLPAAYAVAPLLTSTTPGERITELQTFGIQICRRDDERKTQTGTGERAPPSRYHQTDLDIALSGDRSGEWTSAPALRRCSPTGLQGANVLESVMHPRQRSDALPWATLALTFQSSPLLEDHVGSSFASNAALKRICYGRPRS